MTQETHEALKLADQLTCHPVSRGIEEIEQAGAIIRQQHALIVQMAAALRHARTVFNHHDLLSGVAPVNEAITAAKEYLK